MGSVVLTLAGVAHAQTANAEDGVPLAAQNTCTSCDRPLAQAGQAQSLPATPAPAPSFRLNDLRLNGAQALSADELRAITQPYIGRDVTLADLESLAQAITARYRARGYFLAQALVPVQTVQGGIVEISVIEGRLGKLDVTVAPDAPFSEARVRAFIAPVVPGQAVNAPAYERAMLLLSDQPGLRVSSALQEGTQTGTTDLSVEVAAGPRWAFTAEADNHGTEESGRYRIGPGIDVLDAGVRERGRRVQRNDFSVRAVGAQEVTVKLSRHIPVGSIFAGAGDKTLVFDTVAVVVMRIMRVMRVHIDQ